MLALVVDTSTPAVSAGLVRVGADVQVVAETVVVDGRRHGELLALGVREVLKAGTPDLVVVGVGPGPFTGLRVGIMTAAAFGDARDLPVLGVCSLDGLAEPDSAVVTDARRKEVYWAIYDAEGQRVAGPHVTTPDGAQAAIGDRRVVGDGALLYGFATEQEPRYPSVRRLAEVAVRRHLAGEAALPLTPLYLRRPDATEPGAAKKVTA
ncbi:MAG: peptidase glycoprotease family [Frankiales bacterium]|nr:peptidase glycoprotease family [Frankiales bacterium]